MPRNCDPNSQMHHNRNDNRSNNERSSGKPKLVLHLEECLHPKGLDFDAGDLFSETSFDVVRRLP